MGYLSGCIADFYVKKNIIDEDKKEIYSIGLFLILNDIFNFSMIVILSSIIAKTIFGIEFLLTFCFTRIYCGGFHAKKAYICRITMIVTFLAIIALSKLMNETNIIFIIGIIIVAFIILLPLIPVEHPNKKLSEELKIKNRKKGIISFILFAIVAVVMVSLRKQDGIIIALTLLNVSVLAVVGTVINERRCTG